MKKLSKLTMALAAAMLAAGCGGANSQTATIDALAAQAPTSTSMDLSIDEASGMATAVPDTSVSPDSQTMAPMMDACHPHLFARTAEVVWRLNAVFFRHLMHVEKVLAKKGSLTAGSTATWTDAGRGVLEAQRQLIVSRSDDGLTYTYELDLAPAGQTPPVWVKVLSGSTTTATTSTGTDQTGTVDFDYDALHSVLAIERLTGKIAVAFERVTDSTKPSPGVRKVTTITFDGFSFGPLDVHGPRNGTFTHVGEPGIGGSLTFQDSLVLLCPANPSKAVADAVTHARWFVAADGKIHGRADAKATGGQIPATDTWLGVTCYQGARTAEPVATAESGYWAMKVEDASGATVAGSTHQAGDATSCDALLGAVPSQSDAATDYDFTAAVSFPNQW